MESIKELRQQLQTNVLGHPILQRVLSIYITRPLLSTSVTATQVSVAMVVVAVLGAVLVGFGYFWSGFAVVYLSILLDATDGEIARYRKISSLRSIYMDLVNHLMSQAVFFLGVAVGVAQMTPEPLRTAVLVAGALGALAFPIRRANGDLHRGIYVRPFTDPGLYRLDYTPPAPGAKGEEATPHKAAFNPLRFVAKAVYEMHEFAYMLIAFVVVMLAQQYMVPQVPLAAWLVVLYAATSWVYLVRELVGGFATIDRRVHAVRDRLELRRAKAEKNG